MEGNFLTDKRYILDQMIRTGLAAFASFKQMQNAFATNEALLLAPGEGTT